jgi:hypothetical protein
MNFMLLVIAQVRNLRRRSIDRLRSDRRPWCSPLGKGKGGGRAIAAACGWLGLELDNAANDRGGPRISSAKSRLAAYVIPTDENLMIARQTRALVFA